MNAIETKLYQWATMKIRGTRRPTQAEHEEFLKSAAALIAQRAIQKARLDSTGVRK